MQYYKVTCNIPKMKSDCRVVGGGQILGTEVHSECGHDHGAEPAWEREAGTRCHHSHCCLVSWWIREVFPTPASPITMIWSQIVDSE